MSVIKLKGVSVAYRNNVALHSASLNITPGELVGIIGPNGAGKTTLLTVINGLGILVQGEAKVLGCTMYAHAKGRSFYFTKKVQNLRRKIGYVAQVQNTDPRLPLSAREAVMIGRYGQRGLFRRLNAEDKQIVDQILEEVGMSHLAQRPFGQLSGGEQQKLTIARALAQQPQILLLDEPTASLDQLARQQILTLIRNLHESRGLTTLLVSHDLKDVQEYSNRIILMKSGQILMDGFPEFVLTASNIASAFTKPQDFWVGS